MNKKKEISILMCVYKNDNENYLINALESIRKQTDFFYKLVIVKDGKLGPEVEKVIDKYKKEIKIKTISIKKNVGFPKALNIGLSNINTKWVARFDCDDICDINRFKNINKIIKKHGNKIDVFGTYMKEFETRIEDENQIRLVPLKSKDIKKYLLITNPMNHISVVFKKNLFESFSEKENEFYPPIQGFEDYALWIKLIKNGVRFRNFPIVTVYARVGDNMLQRRGGMKYILNEIKFRVFTSKYLNIFENFIIIIISLIRIIIFSLPIPLKKIFYRLKRNYL